MVRMLAARVAVTMTTLSACVGDLSIDDVPWACTRDAQCGWRARCVDNVCVLMGQQTDGADGTDGADTADAPDTDPPETAGETVVTGMTCEAPVAAMTPDGQAAFTISRRVNDGRPLITVTLDGLTATYPLPPGVEIEADTSGPLLDCCEDPCCPPL